MGCFFTFASIVLQKENQTKELKMFINIFKSNTKVDLAKVVSTREATDASTLPKSNVVSTNEDIEIKLPKSLQKQYH
jgi:hypothetical protein